jgi:hypothetical protein
MKYKITDINYKDEGDNQKELIITDQDLIKYQNVTFINNSGVLQKVNLNLILYLVVKEKTNREITACKIEDFIE